MIFNLLRLDFLTSLVVDIMKVNKIIAKNKHSVITTNKLTML